MCVFTYIESMTNVKLNSILTISRPKSLALIFIHYHFETDSLSYLDSFQMCPPLSSASGAAR